MAASSWALANRSARRMDTVAPAGAVVEASTWSRCDWPRALSWSQRVSELAPAGSGFWRSQVALAWP